MNEYLIKKIIKAKYIDSKKVPCKICGNFFAIGQINRHQKTCNPLTVKIEDKIYSCKFCGKEFLNKKDNLIYGRQARNGHQVQCHLNPDRNKNRDKISVTMQGRKQSDKVKQAISEGMNRCFKLKKELKLKLLNRFEVKKDNLIFTDSLF